MGIFNRRPLCLFCCIFLITSLIVFGLSNNIIVIILISTAAISAVFLGFSFLFKKHHVKFTTLFLCALVMLLATFHSFIFIGIPRSNAEKHIGSHEALCYIIEEEYSSEISEEYYVKIKSIDGEETNIKANLICDFKLGLNAGDEFLGQVRIEAHGSTYSLSDGRLLDAYAESVDDCKVRRHEEVRLWYVVLLSDSGLKIISDQLSDKIKTVLVSTLGEENGLLALGFFTGDRDDMPTDITRDFRRAGVSHLMAVSGSHIAILLGSIELLLRKLYIKKTYRCVFITILSIAFLFISGFALSACRSVIMLYFVYVGYLVYEDSDPLTSLFCSIAIIVLVSPFSAVDLGMYMSFLATLGLLTAYPVFEKMIPYPKKKKGIVKGVLLLLREASLIALMTVISNAYLLPVIWLFFGEISLVSVLSNILMTPISSAYLLCVPLLIILHKIPLVGYCIKWITYLLGEAILFTVRVCSRIPNASISLKYTFCLVIIAIFIIGMVVLLTVKLKRKYLIALPTLFVIIAYAVCLPVSNIFFIEPRVIFLNDGSGNEILMTENDGSFSVCDISNGSSYAYYSVMREFEASTATEIENYIFTHYHKGHVNTFDMLTQKVIVRNVYLPVPDGGEAVELGNDIWRIARDNDINIIIYEDETVFRVSNGLNIQAKSFYSDGEGCFVTIHDDDESFVYSSPYYCNRMPKCDTLLVGVHEVDMNKVWDVNTEAELIILSDKELDKFVNIKYSDCVRLAQKPSYVASFWFNKKD